MKPFLILLTLCTLSLSVYFTYTRFERRDISTIISNDGNTEQEINAKGKIRFNDDETLIASISKNGYLKYRNNTIKLKAFADDQGGVLYQLYEDGTKLNINDKYGRQVLSEALKEILGLGFDARGRVERLFAKGGNQAVLSAVDKLKPGYLKAIYLEYLLSSASLTDDELLQVIRKTGKVDADYEKSKLLISISPLVKDTAAFREYLDVVKDIDADFEKSKVLENIIKQPLDSVEFDETLQIIAGINADYEKSNILKKIINKGPTDPEKSVKVLAVIRDMEADFEKGKLLEIFSTQLDDSVTAMVYLSVVKSMGADFEKTKVLNNILRQPVGGPVYNEIISIAGGMDNDHEKSNLLKKILERRNIESESFGRILIVIHNMDNDFEKVNLLKKLSEKEIPSDEEWIGIINEAGQIELDFAKSSLLTHIAAKMPRNENIKAAYVKAAKTINSETDYGKALKAAD